MFKLEYFAYAVMVTAWIKSMYKMKTTSHYVASKVKLHFNYKVGQSQTCSPPGVRQFDCAFLT